MLKTVRMEWEELFEFDSNLAGYDDRIEDPFPSKQLLSSFLLARRKRDNSQRSYAFPGFPRKRLMGEEEEEGIVGA